MMLKNIFVKAVSAAIMVAALLGAPALASSSNGSGGLLTNRLNQAYVGSQYASSYHIFAEGLDWTKPVGMLIYADGSGEYGLKNPTSDYLLAGTNGLVNVAKRNNMLLVTPFAPNSACSDGSGSCWYMGDPVGYAKWAEELVLYVQGQYPIEKDRVAFGGYSSGAQLATEWWVPSGAAEKTMTDGVIVAISFGGSPKMTQVPYGSDFKSRVHMHWNTGSLDSAYTTNSIYGVMAGYTAYSSNNFDTSMYVDSGIGHSRDGEFGQIMEGQILSHMQVVSNVAPEVAAFTTTVQPKSKSADFTINVPQDTTPATYVYVYWGSGSYLYGYTYTDGNQVPLTISNLPKNTAFTYKVFSDGVMKNQGSFRTLK